MEGDDDYTTIETGDLQILIEQAAQVEYYERLLDYLNDMVPCLDELISNFDENEEK